MKTVKASKRKNSDDVRRFIAKATVPATLVMKVRETMRALPGLMLGTALP